MSKLLHDEESYAMLTMNRYQTRITSQLKRLGGSYDWNRVAFTMDDVSTRIGNAIYSLSHIDYRTSQKLSRRHSVDYTRMGSSIARTDS